MAEEAPIISVADQQSQLMKHPDIQALGTNEDICYVWEFQNEATGTGPHICITRLTKGYDVLKDRAKFFTTHPHIKPDLSKGYKPFPNIFAALNEAESRSLKYDLSDPSRVKANELFPDAPNRILEAGKPNEHPDILARQ